MARDLHKLGREIRIKKATSQLEIPAIEECTTTGQWSTEQYIKQIRQYKGKIDLS